MARPAECLKQLLQLLQSEEPSYADLDRLSDSINIMGIGSADTELLRQVVERLISLLQQLVQDPKAYLLRSVAKSLMQLVSCNPGVLFAPLLDGQVPHVDHIVLLRPIKAALAYGVKIFGKKKALANLAQHSLSTLEQLFGVPGVPLQMVEALAADQFADQLIGHLANSNFQTGPACQGLLKLVRLLADHGHYKHLVPSTFRATEKLLDVISTPIDVLLTLCYCPAIKAEHAQQLEDSIADAAACAFCMLGTGNSQQVADAVSAFDRILRILPDSVKEPVPQHLPPSWRQWLNVDLPAAALARFSEVATDINSQAAAGNSASADSASMDELAAVAKTLMKLLAQYAAQRDLCPHLVEAGVLDVIAKAFPSQQCLMLSDFNKAMMDDVLSIVSDFMDSADIAPPDSPAPSSQSSSPAALQPLLLWCVQKPPLGSSALALKAAGCLETLYETYTPSATIQPQLHDQLSEAEAVVSMLWKATCGSSACPDLVKLVLDLLLHMMPDARETALSDADCLDGAAALVDCFVQPIEDRKSIVIGLMEDIELRLLAADSKANEDSDDLDECVSSQDSEDSCSSEADAEYLTAAVTLLERICLLAAHTKTHVQPLNKLLDILPLILGSDDPDVSESAVPIICAVGIMLEPAANQVNGPSDISAVLADICKMPIMFSTWAHCLSLENIQSQRPASCTPWEWFNIKSGCEAFATIAGLAIRNSSAKDTVSTLLNQVHKLDIMRKIQPVVGYCLTSLPKLSSRSRQFAIDCCTAASDLMLLLHAFYTLPGFSRLPYASQLWQAALQPSTTQMLQRIQLQVRGENEDEVKCRHAAEQALAALQPKTIGSRSPGPVVIPSGVSQPTKPAGTAATARAPKGAAGKPGSTASATLKRKQQDDGTGGKPKSSPAKDTKPAAKRVKVDANDASTGNLTVVLPAAQPPAKPKQPAAAQSAIASVPFAAALPDISNINPQSRYTQAATAIKRLLSLLGDDAKSLKAAASKRLIELTKDPNAKQLFLDEQYALLRLDCEGGDVECIVASLQSWLGV